MNTQQEQLLPIGTKVTFVNDYGLEFKGYTITGYFEPSKESGLDYRLYHQQGYRYYIDSDAPWMPKKPKSLRVE
jgi:hypothetical protein